jgi:hypothetical protein
MGEAVWYGKGLTPLRQVLHDYKYASVAIWCGLEWASEVQTYELKWFKHIDGGQ